MAKRGMRTLFEDSGVAARVTMVTRIFGSLVSRTDFRLYAKKWGNIMRLAISPEGNCRGRDAVDTLWTR